MSEYPYFIAVKTPRGQVGAIAGSRRVMWCEETLGDDQPRTAETMEYWVQLGAGGPFRYYRPEQLEPATQAEVEDAGLDGVGMRIQKPESWR